VPRGQPALHGSILAAAKRTAPSTVGTRTSSNRESQRSFFWFFFFFVFFLLPDAATHPTGQATCRWSRNQRTTPPPPPPRRDDWWLSRRIGRSEISSRPSQLLQQCLMMSFGTARLSLLIRDVNRRWPRFLAFLTTWCPGADTSIETPSALSKGIDGRSRTAPLETAPKNEVFFRVENSPQREQILAWLAPSR